MLTVKQTTNTNLKGLKNYIIMLKKIKNLNYMLSGIIIITVF